jgi:hypothetical protein
MTNAHHLRLSRVAGAAETVVCDALADGFRLEDARAFLGQHQGSTLLRAWVDLDRPATNSDAPKDVYFYAWIPVFSESLYRALIGAGVNAVNFVEIKIAPWNNKLFYACVIQNVFDVLDVKRSRFMLWLSESIPSSLQAAAFMDEIPAGPALFMVPYPGLPGSVLPELFATNELLDSLDLETRKAIGFDG